MSYVRPDRRILRASDADRERAVDFLRRHAGEGRLDVEELSDRVGKALSAKTLGDLDDLTYDLPVEPAALPPATIQSAPPAPRRRSPGTLVAMRIALVYLAMSLALTVHHGFRVLLPILLVVALVALRRVGRGPGRRGGGPARGGPPWQLPY